MTGIVCARCGAPATCWIAGYDQHRTNRGSVTIGARAENLARDYPDGAACGPCAVTAHARLVGIDVIIPSLAATLDGLPT